MKFSDIPKFIRPGRYQINVPLNHLKSCLKGLEEDFGLELNPDFQRGHVWTPEQQSNYIQFLLRGGQSSRIIYFNCKNWMMSDQEGPVQCVDGLQRLTACLEFLDDKVQVYGQTLSEFGEPLPNDLDLIFNINNLPTRKDVLAWYLELNSGGTPHTSEELNRVKQLYAEECTI